MTPDKIMVIAGGLILIGFVYWFFMSKKDTKAVAASGGVDSTGLLQVDIKVEGGYDPEVVSIPLNKTTVLNFTRTDPTGCLEEVVLPSFSARGGSASGGNVRKELPLNKTVAIPITPHKTGIFVYSCGMNMYHGKILVE